MEYRLKSALIFNSILYASVIFLCERFSVLVVAISTIIVDTSNTENAVIDMIAV